MKSASLLDYFYKGTSTTANWLKYIAGLFLMLMMFLTTADVVLRFFKMPVAGAYELIEYMMALIVAFSIAYGEIHKAHINVDILYLRFKPNMRRTIDAFSNLLCTGLFVFFAWRGYIYACKLQLGGDASLIHSIPQYIFVYLFSLGMLVMAALLLSKFLLAVQDLFRNNPKWKAVLFLAIVLIACALLATFLMGKNFPFRVGTYAAGIYGIILMMVLLFLGVPIGPLMCIIGFLGMAYLNGRNPAFNMVGTSPYTESSKYNFSLIPLFVMMGSFCLYSGLGQQLYNTANKFIGHFRGGLAMATVAACAGFAAVSGSSVATTATMGMVALPEMRKYNYSPSLATGVIASGGSLGVLIPPSTILVLYAILTDQSIGKLFMAGFLPGLTEALFYMVTIYIVVRLRPEIAPMAPRASWHERILSLKDTWGIILLFIIVIGGIYGGVFTPTEAGGIGAFGAFCFVVFRGKLTKANLSATLAETMKSTAMVFVIMIGAAILGYFLAVTRLTFDLSNFIGGLEINRYIILFIILVVYLVLGAVMSAMAMVVLTVPIIFPVIVSLGFDPIWFGIIIVRMVEIGQITPPVGINVYVMKGVAPDIPLGTIFKGILPFLIADICHVTVLILIPGIATFLPSLM